MQFLKRKQGLRADFRGLVGFTVLLTLAVPMRALEPAFEIQAREISSAIRLDGLLDEPAWSTASRVDRFLQREPLEGEPASERTEVRIIHDKDCLYIGVFCFDSEPKGIVATEMRRDAELKNNDYFEVVLDTFLSRRNGFYFAVNPLGARRDALIRDDGSNVNWDWDGIWEACVRISDQGWAAELAIPFRTLRFPKLTDQTWGVNFGRHIARKREEIFWTPILRDYGREGNFRISYLGRLKGLSHLQPGGRYQIMPYVIGGGEQPEPNEPFKLAGDLGLDIKARITSNLTADITVNTDFAQVEADQEQFNLTRFSLFLPEKRRFFLEGADIFRMGERFRMHETPAAIMFFSRTIGLSEDGREVPILAGARVTGKTGAYDLGVMNILTDRTAYTVDEERVEIERSNTSVFRLKRDFLQKSSFGAMLLSKDSLDSSSYNRGAGLDFNLAVGRYIKCSGFAGKTFTPGLRDRDWAAYFDFIWESDLLNVDLSYLDIGENFNTEMGFVNRTDIRKMRSNISIRPRPGILGIRKSYFYNKIIYIEDHAGRLESRMVSFGNYNKFQNGAMLMVSYERSFEFLEETFEISDDVVIPSGKHAFAQFGGRLESDMSRKYAVSAEGKTGDFYNGRLFHLNGRGYLKFSRRLNLEVVYGRDRFNLPVPGGVFTAHILAGRLVYSFSPDLFAKAYVQWNSEEGLFKSNFLIRWIYKPGANLYFIYNETREVGQTSFLQDRVVLLKVSFLFGG